MKKIIIISIILLVGFSIFWLFYPYRMVTAGLDFVGEYEADMSGVFSTSYKDYARRIDADITWWDQYIELQDLKDAEEAYQTTLPHTIDFEKEMCIASFGRKIVDIQYENNSDNAFRARIPIFTYEEEYHENKMFLYTIKHWEGFLSPNLYVNPSYLMVDGERVPF